MCWLLRNLSPLRWVVEYDVAGWQSHKRNLARKLRWFQNEKEKISSAGSHG
jgi:hypothetical protein